MNYKRWEDMIALQGRLIEVLTQTAKMDPREYDLEVRMIWIEAMTWAEAHEGCLIPSLDDVIRADTYNAGHVDWCSKFPLYVAEMVYGVDPWR